MTTPSSPIPPPSSEDDVAHMRGTKVMNDFRAAMSASMITPGEPPSMHGIVPVMESHLLPLFYAADWARREEEIRAFWEREVSASNGSVLKLRPPRRSGKSTLVARAAAALLASCEGLNVAIVSRSYAYGDQCDEMKTRALQFTTQLDVDFTVNMQRRRRFLVCRKEDWQSHSTLECREIEEFALSSEDMRDFDVVFLDECDQFLTEHPEALVGCEARVISLFAPIARAMEIVASAA